MATVKKVSTLQEKLTAAKVFGYVDQIKDAISVSEDKPVHVFVEYELLSIRRLSKDNFWLYKGYVYSVHGPCTDEEAELLILEYADKERRKFERLKKKFTSPETVEASRTRPSIPEQVRIEVWRRDGGKCVKCGSRENLEYDHIIPISKGGSNTTRNIELLCEKCNRSKSNKIE
jgi:hypothetical protein